MNFISASAIVIKLLPIIVDAVKAIEEADQRPGQGKQKLQAVLTIVRAVYEAAEPGNVGKFDGAIAAITAVVAALVEFFNSTGLFKKKSQEAQAAA